ncbi:MAG: hypothetical protein LPK07_15845 [Hymenobacteraceae bacterium]|nr:hypothetical protein [Hymenobacteraceae bacterium]MDX5483152.1 hypothetical protein [Hymenobacteraceae bacterium]
MSLSDLFLREIQHELAKPQQQRQVLAQEHLTLLPPLLQHYLRNSGFVGKPLGQNCYVVWEDASLKLRPDKDWTHISCIQFNAAHGPMRNALMRSKMLGLIPLSGKDKYQDGKGNMLIKLAAFTVSEAKGPEMDVSALVTFLAEAVLLPAALLGEYIAWQQVDENILRATISHAGATASGNFFFSTDFLPYKFESEDRYYATGKSPAQKFLWTAYYAGFKDMRGYWLPTELKASWQLPDGEYTYFDGKIKSVTFDIAAVSQIRVS